MAEFVLSPDAENDLDEIHARISLDNPKAANQVLDAAYLSFQELARTPGLGRPRTFAQSELCGLRSWHVGRFKNYLIFYRPLSHERGVEIIRVLHAARDFEAIFES